MTSSLEEMDRDQGDNAREVPTSFCCRVNPSGGHYLHLLVLPAIHTHTAIIVVHSESACFY